MKILVFIFLAIFGIGIVGLFVFNKTDTPVSNEIIEFKNQTGSQTETPTEISQTHAVSLVRGEDVVRLFLNVLSEKRIVEAVDMLDENIAPNDSSRQSWGVQFNEMETVSIRNIEPWIKNEWSETKERYKVTASVEMNFESEDAVIPYYGWDGDPDIRWITIVKNISGIWKISEIATGP